MSCGREGSGNGGDERLRDVTELEQKGDLGEEGGRWWWVGESTVTKHQVLASAASPCPLVPVVLLCAIYHSTTTSQLPTCQTQTSSLWGFWTSQYWNNYSLFLKSPPLSKRDEMFSIVSPPFEFVIMKNDVRSWLWTAGCDEMRWGKQGNVQYWLLGSFWWLDAYLRVL